MDLHVVRSGLAGCLISISFQKRSHRNSLVLKRKTPAVLFAFSVTNRLRTTWTRKRLHQRQASLGFGKIACLEDYFGRLLTWAPARK